MGRRVLVASLSFSLVTMVFIIVLAPASLISWGCSQVRLQCSFAEVQGTIWTGDASNGTIKNNGYGVYLTQLEWSLNSGLGTSYGPHVDIRVVDPSGFITTKLAPIESALWIHDLNADYQIRQPNLALDATLVINSARWDFAETIDSVNGQVLISNLAVQVNDIRIELGDFAGRLSSQGENLVIEPVTVRSAFIVSGACALSGRRYRCDLEVNARAVNDERIHRGLGLMGRETSSQIYLITLAGAI